MAANEREFTLIGRFDDQITKKLKAINEELNKLNKPLAKDNVTKSLKGGFEAANKELKTLQEQLTQVGKFKMKFDKSGIQAATEEVKVLGKEIDSVAKAGFKFDKSGVTAAIEEVKVLGETINSVSRQGFEFDKSGIVAAQKEADVLGDILKANALIQVGEGFANALTAGATSAVNILQRGMGFIGSRFKEATDDQLQDVMARGSLFGSLQKQGMFKGAMEGKEGQALKDASNDMYIQTKNISRAMDNSINEIIRTSTVSSETIQILSRQLGDNLLPTLLKEKQITDLSNVSREKLNEIMGGEKGVGQQLANLYSQIGSVIPNAGYARQAGFGVTQFLGAGTINRQLAIFEQNPILVDALKEGLKKFGNTVEGRIKAAAYGFSIAMPEAALQEAKNTIAGGLQSLNDTLLGPSGILTFTADISGQGKRTLDMMTKSGVRADEIKNFDRKQAEVLAGYKKQNVTQAQIQEMETQQIAGRKRFIANLDDFYQSADSPIEVLATQFGPLLQSFANMINNAGNLFIAPVNNLVETMAPSITKLKDNFESLGSDLAKFVKTKGLEGRSFGEVLGRAMGEIFKALAEYFNPQKAGKQIGDGINTFFDDFMRGFKNEKFDGEKYMKIVLDTLQSIIMKLIFKEGNVMKGMTGLGDALAKVFLLLAAPAFISALISGLVPIALMGMGGLVKAVFKVLTAEVVGASGARGAAGAGAAGAGARGLGAFITPGGARVASNLRGGAAFGKELLGLAYSLGGRPGLKAVRGIGGAVGKVSGAVGKVGRFVPGGALAFGALDAGLRIASGENAGRAIGGAAATTIGSVLGGILGQALIPVPGLGAAVGAVAGGVIGDQVGSLLMGPADAQARAAEAQKFAADAMKSASNKYGAEAKDLGGVEALSQKFGGGAGFGAWLDKQKEIGKLSQKEYTQGRVLASEMATLNVATNNVKNTQARLAEATTLNTGQQKKIAAELEVAKQKQKSAMDIITQQWGTMDSANKLKILTSADILASAIQAAAGKISGINPTGAGGRPLSDASLAGPPGSGFLRNPSGRLLPTSAQGVQIPTGKGHWETTGSRGSAKQTWVPDKPTGAHAFGSDRPFMGNLGEAINFEMANKPANSHLVIANSSEHIYTKDQHDKLTGGGGPVFSAAGGLGGGLGGGLQGVIAAIWGAAQMTTSSMARDMERTTLNTVSHIGTGLDRLSSNTTSTLTRGFDHLGRTTSSGQSQISQAISHSQSQNSNQNQQILSAIRAAAAAGGFGGGALGGIPGSLNAAASLASSMGLQLTSFKRNGPASASYHNVGRAMDFSNGSGPTPQMMKFAQTMAARHGSSLTELIYTPLGYGIKHGRKVPPYAQAGHYNHVHVAYAGGPGNPALFPTQELARKFEENMIPPNLKVRSITTNSSEALGPVPSPAPINVTVNPKIDVGMDQIGYSIRFGQEKVTQALDRYLGITTRQNQQTLDAIRAAAAAGGFGGGLNVATGSQMGVGNMAAVARSVGFKGRGASVMGAIGMAESGGNPRAHNPVPPDNSYGLWQINMLGAMGPERRKAFGLSANEQLYNPMVNAKAALSISGGGTNFRPWSTYTSGAYKKYMSSELQHVAYALGKGRPALFSTQLAAEAWERKMIPSSMKVRSITTNSGETNFGSTTLHAPITIYQQPNQDAEQLASMVAIRIGMAVDELRNRA